MSGCVQFGIWPYLSGVWLGESKNGRQMSKTSVLKRVYGWVNLRTDVKNMCLEKRLDHMLKIS